MADINEVVKINFRVSVKAFIVNKEKLLLLKRVSNDKQSPDIWEIPGGRLELGEDPLIGIEREVQEETGLYITPVLPLSIRHFKRNDGQIITMIIFFCKLFGGDLTLSEEHTTHKWIDLKECKKSLAGFFHKEVDIFSRLNIAGFS